MSLYKTSIQITDSSTIVTKHNGRIIATPIYPVFNSKNRDSFSVAELMPAVIKLDCREYITYPLCPNKDVNLISISNLEETTLSFSLEDNVTIERMWFYIGELNPYGYTLPYEVEMGFEKGDGDSSNMIIDEPIESYDPLHDIKGRLKATVNLDTGVINARIEDVSVVDRNGNDVSDKFHFVGYTVRATKVATLPNN